LFRFKIQKMKIAVITPVSHLQGINSLLESKGNVFYLENNPTKLEVKSLLEIEKIDTIVCNPNQQTYKIDEELLQGTNVNLINTCSTGMNHIDVEYCKKQNIKILSLTKDYELIKQLPSTSELAFGLMMSLLRSIPQSKQHVSEYNWDYTPFVGREVKSLTIGIVGYGRLGKMMHDYCKAFGADVKVYDPYKREEMDDAFLLNTYCSLTDMFEQCDVISLHVHVTPETKYMINKKILGYSKKSPYIINTSRGEIVNEQDIVEALKNKVISGYGADVVENEFDDLQSSPIIQAMNREENIIVTPHIGGMTIEGQTRAYKWAINKL
jgi:D-3-phosphoglycerate dehydrogenase / 2-oxoglutarate reductase